MPTPNEIRAALRTLPTRVEARLPNRPELYKALADEVEKVLEFYLGPEATSATNEPST